MMRASCFTNVLSGAAVLGGAFVITAAASAQCVINPSPNYVQNDGGCPAVAPATDPNGGCNYVPSAFQHTGSVNGSNSFTIGGTVGADTSGRDLDWYSFDVTAGCYVNISATMTDPAGAAAVGNLLVFTGTFTDPATPDCNSPLGFAYNCPATVTEFFAQPGRYMVIITTRFATDTPAGLPCNSPYTITVSSRPLANPSCGSPTSGDCLTATPTTGGCQDAACCDLVCNANPLCCDIAWDAGCVTIATTPAPGGCGLFLYSCPPAAGAPANDCATSAQAVAFNQLTAFNNAAATTDGPNNGTCAAGTLKDVWFVTQAPDNGNITLTCNSPGQDVVLHVHGLGTSSTIDGSLLVDNFIGCVDNLGLGGEAVTLTGCVSGEYYLWRVGQWNDPAAGTAGAGDVTFAFEQTVWSTGNHAPICPPGGAATNLGLSSGAIGATLPQRWLAAPFVVNDPDGSGPSTKWRVTTLVPEGFQPGGTLNERMNWILWSRSGTTAPNYATNQIASGSVVYGALGGNGEAYIDVDFELNPGTYYLTVFASAFGNPCRANDGQTVYSNFAWFVGAPNGLAFNNGTTWYQWRSAVQPGSGPADEVVVVNTTNPCEGGTAAGFTLYNGLNGAYVNCTSQQIDQTVYSPAFTIFGAPVVVANPCPADLNNDGVVGPADLSVLLNGWGGTTPDLSGDGQVGAADLSIMLNAWGACQ